MATELETLFQLFKQENEKFESKGTQTSATKARAHLLSIKKNADTMRKEILIKAKSLKSAKKAKKTPATTEPVPEPPASPKKKTKRKPKKT
jgi:hypothetical protein